MRVIGRFPKQSDGGVYCERTSLRIPSYADAETSHSKSRMQLTEYGSVLTFEAGRERREASNAKLDLSQAGHRRALRQSMKEKMKKTTEGTTAADVKGS